MQALSLLILVLKKWISSCNKLLFPVGTSVLNLHIYFFPRVIPKYMSKALGRHVLINILLINYKRGVIGYSWSSVHLQLLQTSPRQRWQILGPHKKPWKEHAVLETHLVMPSLRMSQKCRRVEGSNIHIFIHISSDIQLSALSSVVFTV